VDEQRPTSTQLSQAGRQVLRGDKAVGTATTAGDGPDSDACRNRKAAHTYEGILESLRWRHVMPWTLKLHPPPPARSGHVLQRRGDHRPRCESVKKECVLIYRARSV
jgi:hypothetical protein